jgi:hypothetical protein
MEHYRYDSLFHKYSVVVFIIGNWLYKYYYG